MKVMCYFLDPLESDVSYVVAYRIGKSMILISMTLMKTNLCETVLVRILESVKLLVRTDSKTKRASLAGLFLCFANLILSGLQLDSRVLITTTYKTIKGILV
jgi:hypothetical protein